MTSKKILEKSEVREYFNGTGFDRWNKIYSKSDEINTVQKNIRKGHQKTVDDVITYIKHYPELTKKSFCDAGCGVGSLAIPLLRLGIQDLQLSDISSEMIKETKKGDGVWDPTPGLNALAGWASSDGTAQAVEFAILDGFETEYPIELSCLTIASGETPPVYECYYDEFTGTWNFPPMPAYTTIQIVAIINVGSDAALGDQSMGIKALSEFGDSFIKTWYKRFAVKRHFF